MATCLSGDGCDRKATAGRNFCAEHAAQLDRVRDAIGKPERVTNKTAPARSKADRQALDDANAKKLARVVCAQDVPVTGLAERAGLRPHSDAYKAALALAESRGWIALDNGRGHVAGPNSPEETPAKRRPVALAVRAQRIADHVTEHGRVTREVAATAAGLDGIGRTFSRALKHAVDAGLVTADRDGVGPPVAVEQAAA